MRVYRTAEGAYWSREEAKLGLVAINVSDSRGSDDFAAKEVHLEALRPLKVS